MRLFKTYLNKSIFKRIFLLTVFFLLYVSYTRAQDPDSHIRPSHNLEIFYQNGYVFPTDPFLRGYNAVSDGIDAYQAFSLRFSKQTIGNKLWEQLYKYPVWGGGVYVADFFNPQEVGTPIAIYGFFNAPFKRWDRWSFNYTLGFGLAFNWKHYGPTNIYNVAVGAPFTVYIDAGMNMEYRIADKWNAALGFSLSHFSNGALKRPNKGINTVAPRISLMYRFGEGKTVFIRQDIPKFSGSNEWLFSVFGGSQNILTDTSNITLEEKYEGVFFPVFGILTTYNRYISYKSKIGFGVSVSYDGSVNAKIAVENGELEEKEAPFGEKLQISIYPSYSLVVNRISVIIQPGVYLYRKKFALQTPVFYQRIGLNYQINNHLTAGINLRAYHFHVSNYIEWNVGYRLPW